MMVYRLNDVSKTFGGQSSRDHLGQLTLNVVPASVLLTALSTVMIAVIYTFLLRMLSELSSLVGSVRLFVRYCGQESSLLWTPAMRPYVGPMHLPTRGGELIGV